MQLTPDGIRAAFAGKHGDVYKRRLFSGCVAIWIATICVLAAAEYPSPFEKTASRATVHEDVLLLSPDVCLNTASAEELMTLDGIGAILAQRIIAYRDSHAGFDHIDELLNVEGIGEARYQKVAPYVYVGIWQESQ